MTQWGLDTLFNPAKRHMDEEKRRLQSTREEVGDNSGGKRIDFESGKVVIHRSTESESDEASTERDPSATEGDQKTVESAKSDQPPAAKPGSKSQPSAAAIRAAERRGRKPR